MIDGIQPPQRPNQPPETPDTNTEPQFTPPEVVAAAETEAPSSIAEPVQRKQFAPPKPTKKRRRSPIAVFAALSKKQKILAIVLLVVILGALGGGTYALLKKPAKTTLAPVADKQAEPVKATPIYSPLTGATVTKEQSELPVTAVMIENSPDARPQSGLNEAGVVFEAIAEGGITRFLTLWQEARPDYVGPVRSVRPYYVDWLQGFDAAVAHVGGSAEALQKIKNEGVKDLDQFYNPGPYKRVSNRYAPHNMYTSMTALLDLQRSKGWGTSTFSGFPRKTEAASSTPTARSIDITISGALYNVHYDYNAAGNNYLRSEGGKPHLDERSKQQISPKVVIAIVVPYSIQRDGIHSTYGTIGSGKTYIFQDGIAAEGTWEKTSAKSQITFKDAAGNPIKLNPGQTWITATSIANNVVYKP